MAAKRARHAVTSRWTVHRLQSRLRRRVGTIGRNSGRPSSRLESAAGDSQLSLHLGDVSLDLAGPCFASLRGDDTGEHLGEERLDARLRFAPQRRPQ